MHYKRAKSQLDVSQVNLMPSYREPHAGFAISGRFSSFGRPVYSSFGGASARPARSVSQSSYPPRREIGSQTPELGSSMATAGTNTSKPFSQFPTASPSLSHLTTGRPFGTVTRELMGSSSPGGPSICSTSTPSLMHPAASLRTRGVFDAERVGALGPATTVTPRKLLDAASARSQQGSTGLTLLPSTDRWQPGLLGAHATVHRDAQRPGHDNHGIFNTYLNTMVRSSPLMYFPQLGASPRPRPDYPSSMS